MDNLEQEIWLSLQQLETQIGEFIAFYKEDLDFSIMVYTHWDAKDILGHITFWHESFARNLKAVSDKEKPNVLKGKLSEVNQQSVATTKEVSIGRLIERIIAAQKTIAKHIKNAEVELIPYKQGSRDYSRLEHLQIVTAHIKRHLTDLQKKFKR